MRSDGRRRSHVAAVLRCWAGDVERLRRCSVTSRSSWWGWLGSKVNGSGKSRAGGGELGLTGDEVRRQRKIG
jgi:hypothetical protein